MPVRTLITAKRGESAGTVQVHNAALFPISFRYGGVDGQGAERITMSIGEEWEVPAGYAHLARDVRVAIDSPETHKTDKGEIVPTGKVFKRFKALKSLSPHLRIGPASLSPWLPQNAPAKAPSGPPEPVPSSPNAVQAEVEVGAPDAPSADVDEVAKLVAENDKDELKQMAKDLGLDVRGNLSEQTLAERIVAAMK